MRMSLPTDLKKLKNDPEVLSKLDNVLKEAYEKVYGEIPTSEEAESDVPYNQEPAPGMEDVVHSLGDFLSKAHVIQGVAREVQNCVQQRTSLCEVPGMWKGTELHESCKLLATCGEQELLSSTRPGVLEERTPSSKG